ncbi:kinase-like domain-containing protein [Trichoderma sp. SZMC 28013]
MSGEASEAQPAPRTDVVTFARFSAANTAAAHLLDNIRSELSPSSLKLHGKTIGYELSIPLSSTSKHGSKDMWRIGAGPPTAIVERKLDHVKPDILLCPPDGSLSATLARQFIKDLHAAIRFHAKSGVVMLKTTSRRPVTYEQGEIDQTDLELTSEKIQSCVMRWSQNFIRFGDYRFVFEIVAQDPAKDKVKTHRSGYRGLYPSPALGPIPMTHAKTSWNIWLHNKIPDTSITSGVNIYTGDPVAVKQLHSKIAMLPYTSNRLQVARQYDEKRDKGVLGIIDVWCEHGISPPCFYNRLDKVDDNGCEQTFYSMPLAKNNFRNMPWGNIEFEKRLALFYQTLLGLADLHQQNITHGHILPESLLIFTEPESATNAQSPPRRAVISLSMRKRNEKPDPSVCVAPEVWSRQGEQNGDLDEAKLDIWALAASWLFAFTAPPKNMKIIKHSYGDLKVTLDTQFKRGLIKEPLVKLLRQMLAWKPRDRPSAADALADEVWNPIRDKMREEEDGRKRKRLDMMKSVDGGDKRVRVLSPDPDE